MSLFPTTRRIGYREFLETLRRYRPSVFILLAVLNVYLFHYTPLRDLKLIHTFEGNFLDVRYQWPTTREISSTIVIVGVDDSSFNLERIPEVDIAKSRALQLITPHWPWDREIFALLLQRLIEAGAKMVIFDFVFEGASPGDALFAEAMDEHRDRFAMGSRFEYQITDIGERRVVLNYPSDEVLPEDFEGLDGYVNFDPDPDGVIRRAKHATSLRAEIGYESELDLFSLTALAARKLRKGIKIPPRDRSNLIHFSSPRISYPTVPIENVFLEDRWQHSHMKGGELFRDKIVIVGPLSEIRFKDMHPSPIGIIPGPQIQAIALESLLNNNHIRELPTWAIVVLSATLSLSVCLICLRCQQALLKFCLLLSLTFLFAVITQWLFESLLLSVPVTGVFPPSSSSEG